MICNFSRSEIDGNLSKLVSWLWEQGGGARHLIVEVRVGGREAIAITAMCGWLAAQCEHEVGGAEDVIGPWVCWAVIVPIGVAD